MNMTHPEIQHAQQRRERPRHATVEKCGVSLFMALVVLFGGAAAGSCEPSEREVIDSIQLMIDKPLTTEALEAGSTVVAFAESSSKVNVLVAPQFWSPAEHGDRGHELLAYYIAGATRYDLENQTRDHAAFANVPTAIRTMLFAYRTLIGASPDQKSEFFDYLSTLDRDGLLDDYVTDCMTNASPRKS